MEALVVASAAVVCVYGYRTVMEIITDIEHDGSWELLTDAVRQALAATDLLHRRVSRTASNHLMSFHALVMASRKRHHRNMLLKPHA